MSKQIKYEYIDCMSALPINWVPLNWVPPISLRMIAAISLDVKHRNKPYIVIKRIRD